ncbi:INO80 complex subunit C-like isoform X1 [Coregonus clupeaformis]|uniref:INO80 complex subunit C-like isoform X1 n=1 Tax=Coregonus clupeaformis TaxID=59861 RepID=UPI001E1C93B6|nr:INO80 complex subunit C-like isoform X1 [Coregonus clupeaformis]
MNILFLPLIIYREMASPNHNPGVAGTVTVTASPAGKTQTLVVASSPAGLRGKKRPANTATSPALPASGNNSKKKKQPIANQTQAQVAAVEAVSEGKAVGVSDAVAPATTDPAAKPLPFKDPIFVHSGIGGAAAGKKNRTWKNLKQILSVERTLPWKINDPNYYSIDAPPSLKPAKKYSDISGLPANYTDPQTKLRFTSSEEFSFLRLLPTDAVTGYLALRKATCIVP